MRQSQDDDVVLGEDLRLGGLDDAVRQGQQVRVVVPELTAGGRGRGECTDLHPGVGREQAQDLTACVPGGSGNSNCPSHAATIHALA